MKTLSLFSLFLFLLVTSLLWADKLYLKDGRVLEGEITDDGDIVSIKLKFGKLKFSRDKVERIEKKASAKSQFSKKLKAAGENVEALISLGELAQKKKLKGEFQQVIGKLKKLAPDHAKVKELIYEFEKEEREFENDEVREKKILSQLGAGFKVTRSQHFLVFYNCSPQFAKRRKGLFERLYDKFYKYWENKGFELDTLNNRLVCILFKSRESFQEYARRTGGMAQAAGYWNSRTNWTYFYDTGVSAQIAKHEKAIKEWKQKNKELAKKIKQPGWNTKENKKILKENKKRLKEYEKRIESHVEDENLSVTVHEATHQLCYNLGILKMHRGSPTWLVEGIAVYFETRSPSGIWSGPGAKNDKYIKNVNKAYQSKKVVPFEKFLAMTESFFSGGIDTGAGYALSWCFVRFLMRSNTYEKKLLDYMKDLQKLDSRKTYSKKEVLALIKKHFGSLDKMKSAWESQMRSFGAMPK